MRTILAMLAATAGFGLTVAGEAMAEAKNLSCISGIAPNEQRLIRDCEPEPEPDIFYVYEVPVQPPPPPPIPMKNGESGKGGGAHPGHDHDAPAGGGEPGGPSF